MPMEVRHRITERRQIDFDRRQFRPKHLLDTHHRIHATVSLGRG